MAHEEGGGPGSAIGKIIIFILIIGILVYAFNSGFFANGTHGFTSIFPSLHSASNTLFSSGPPGFGGGGTPAATPIGSQSPFQTYIGPPAPTSTLFGAGGLNPSEIPAGFTASQTSPYFHEVRIGGASGGGFFASFSGFGAYGQITLYSYLNQNETVDITGWSLHANHGGVYIPQAIGVYDPSGFTPPSDIQLGNGQVVYLYSTSGYTNLRLNECTGYLREDLNTNPPLPLTCPSIDRSQISTFSGQCQNYITSIPSCTIPNTNSSQIPPNDYACQQYLNTINYKGCFDAHRGDANFLSNEWWVWTGSTITDPYHDVINLFDRNGLLVDQYSY